VNHLSSTGTPFSATHRLEGRIGVIEVEGELDVASMDRLEQVAGPAIDQGSRIVLDLSACPFIDSHGLRFVLHTHRVLTADRPDGNPMAVVGNGEVEKMLSLTAIDQTIPVVATLNDALELFHFGAAGLYRASSVTGTGLHVTGAFM
jgi:anti-anti-sigma factor